MQKSLRVVVVVRDAQHVQAADVAADQARPGLHGELDAAAEHGIGRADPANLRCV